MEARTPRPIRSRWTGGSSPDAAGRPALSRSPGRRNRDGRAMDNFSRTLYAIEQR